LDISDPITSSPCTRIWPAFAFCSPGAVQLGEPPPNVRSSHRVKSPTPIPPPRTSTESRCVLKSRQTPTAVVTCVWQKQQRLFGTPSFPGARSSQASSGVPYQLAVTDLHQVPPRTSPLLCAQALAHAQPPPRALLFAAHLLSATASSPQRQRKDRFQSSSSPAVPIFNLHKRRNSSQLSALHPLSPPQT
jgi:hypothetical protein